MNDWEFQQASTDEGRDVDEGEMAYRIEERGGQFEVVEYLPDEPDRGEPIHSCRTREGAADAIRIFIRIRDARGAERERLQERLMDVL